MLGKTIPKQVEESDLGSSGSLNPILRLVFGIHPPLREISLANQSSYSFSVYGVKD